MSTLAIVLLLAVIAAALWGAVTLTFWLIVGAIVYLCICSIIEKIQSWLNS